MVTEGSSHRARRAEAAERVDARLRVVLRHLREHAHERVRLKDLATLTGVSTSYLARSFRQAMRSSIHQYLMRLRVARAIPLLRAGQSLTTVANATGFADKSHLVRSFRRVTGKTPRAFSSER